MNLLMNRQGMSDREPDLKELSLDKRLSVKMKEKNCFLRLILVLFT